MGFIPKFLKYEPTNELEKISCCWKCKELNPETKTEDRSSGDHHFTIYICTTCGQQVTSLVHYRVREKLSGLLFKLSFSVCIVLTPLLAFYDGSGFSWSGFSSLFEAGFVLLLVIATIPFGLWAYFKLKLTKRSAILEEIDRLPKPKAPPKKPNSLPPKIN